jgi:ribosomal protein L30/L7E
LRSSRIELRINVDTLEIESERGVQLLRGALPVGETVEHVLSRLRLAKRAKQILYEFGPRTPDVLRAKHHHALNAIECAQPLQLPVQCKDWRTQTHIAASP